MPDKNALVAFMPALLLPNKAVFKVGRRTVGVRRVKEFLVVHRFKKKMLNGSPWFRQITVLLAVHFIVLSVFMNDSQKALS
jgi:hypothetical protein